MEVFGLRRTQSLRSLSGAQERSWVMPAAANWNRKSVSQLVQHYQSCADLSSCEKAEQKLEASENCVDDGCRFDSRKSQAVWESGRLSAHSRSRSMDFLPQKDKLGTRALCALFESKATLQQSFNSSPRLNSFSEVDGKAMIDCPLQDKVSHNTTPKDTWIQRTTQEDVGKPTNGRYSRAARQSHDDKYNSSVSRSSPPTTKSRDRATTSPSVRDRSALYLSRAAADSTGGPVHPEVTENSATRTKRSKMAEAVSRVRVSQPPHEEEDLPPPPPPPVPSRPTDYEDPAALPVPPPKETFSSFYEQRQKSELKRLFKHIHPDLRAGLDDAVDDDIMKAVQSEGNQDPAYSGEVQSMKWIFENWTLDNIGDPHETRKLLLEEELKGGDVRNTSLVFEGNENPILKPVERQTSVMGDVRTSMWLFETQPLDSFNKPNSEESELVEALLKEPIQPGNVRGTRLLFESKPLSDLGRSNSCVDHSFLKLKSELQEQKGDVQKTVKLFQTDPGCAIRDTSGNIHEIKSICREEINSSEIRTARWLFETQPLDLINKGSDGVKIIRGISLEEGQKGGVDQKRWMFETQTFDTIQEVVGTDKLEAQVAICPGEADVSNKRKLFEMQPLASLKGDADETFVEKEEVIGGDVKTSLWLFETQPMEAFGENYEVGHLKKITISAEEQGEVRDRKQLFQNGGTHEDILPKEQVMEKGDVKGFKQLFETIVSSKSAQSQETFAKVKTIEGGNVKENKLKFETTPLYAIKDSSGNLHEVTTVSREEFIKGKVKNYKWMFETKPLDQLAERKGSVEVIKGITRQEESTGDVKMAKWLFETQTIDNIHCKVNQTEKTSAEKGELCKGDVKSCKWLFETQPMNVRYEKSEKLKNEDLTDGTNVKSITWLFESQPLDNIRHGEPYNLRLCGTVQDSVKSKVDIQTVKHLFETETLDRIRKDSDSEQDLRCISQVDFQSGDVSRVKELFESHSLDEIGSEIVKTSESQSQEEQIEKGSVHKVTWMFENCPMNLINKDNDEANTQKLFCESGDVQNKKFIFETSSLDRIQKKPLEEVSASVEGPASNVDVKSSTMMFESLPLYAIRDKEGQFHEVTTVKKEEVLSGDVRGARWMFETKPLDAIKAEKEVYVIRAVTQEDVKKGGVESARWKFETQPLDSFGSQEEPSVRVSEDFGSSSVQENKKLFESDQSNQKFVRTVSVTDVQRGDVRTSTWLFENQTIDRLKGEPEEQSQVKRVHREDSQKGDVKRCTWLFESQPLDKIKDSENTTVQDVEEMPKADVKCTTWLFETTPLDKITANSVTDTLSYLHQNHFVQSSGIVIEAKESKTITMAKYLLESNTGVQIQKEDVVEGNISNIMLQLLLTPTLAPQITLLRQTEKGEVNTTVVELPVLELTYSTTIDSDQRVRNIVQTIDQLLIPNKNLKKGIIMQETGEGRAEMSVYSLYINTETRTESHVTERGDVKSTIGNLLASAHSQRPAVSCRVDESEKGNVNLYKSCIEKGDLEYLRSLHAEASESEVDDGLLVKEQLDTVHGSVKEAKKSLCHQKEHIERSICDVLPGDVKNTKKVFSSECALSIDSCMSKEEIIPGDVSSAKQQLFVKQPIVLDKEEVVAGDIKATMESLELAKEQSMHMEREIIVPGTIYDMDLSTQGPIEEGNQAQKEVIISGNVKAAKRSLEMAKQQSMHVEREVVVPGKIYNLSTMAQEESSTTVMQSSHSSSSKCQQIRTHPKVSDAERNHRGQIFFEACRPSEFVDNSCATESKPRSDVCDFNGHTTEDETEEIIKGDVKAAIRSLQSPPADHKIVEKNNVVRGNMQLALESLEKSNINVSRGDYKAAMIYRNSGRACSRRNRTVHNHCAVVSVPPSDTLSPSISVTCEGQPAIATQSPSPNPIAYGNTQASSSEGVTPPLPPEKGEKPQEQKPALPPKPQWMKSVPPERPNTLPTPAPSTASPLTQKHPVRTMPQNKRQDVPAHQTINKYADEVDINQTSVSIVSTIEDCKEKAQMSLTKTEADIQLLENEDGIKKINAAEEIQMCKRRHAEEGKEEMNTSLQSVVQKFDRQNGEVSNPRPVLAKKVKVTNDRKTDKSDTNGEMSQINNSVDAWQPHLKVQQKPDCQDKVVLREKKGRETEDERRQRLSIHKEEIMRENEEAALEIFENLRKREELKGVLSQVKEIEGESSVEEKSSVKTLYVPEWMVSSKTAKQSKMAAKKVEAEVQDDDMESISSVEMAFEDLEKASKDIRKLKEQTLTKLLNIEETIKKALYSVSNLKSEADIAGLSGLFDESLKSEQSLQPANNIKKISIVSSKTKPGVPKGTTDSKCPKEEAPKKPLVRQSSSQSSPSFISIHSARKPMEQPKPTMTTFKPQTDSANHSSDRPQHQVSVLEVKTLPEKPAGVIDTKTVSETYEESDGFGNVFVSSVTSTFVSNHSDSKASSLFEAMGSPTRYETVTSPLMRRPGGLFEEKVFSRPKEEGTVFVTFSRPK
ncbi:xin actin-binding repeat-containing protein 1 isoform X1 [Oryzias melastigma]|nr:xin actin-binding repeat-containing protein 1 isoform X1 [Oryzias melastigma]XP_036072313.1 xin actin-binding repeat-containing protein 1 isoform X1 [Oryzias melastigma]